LPRYLTLSKAARLVGVKRGALQEKIRAGELSTFEGMLELDELLRVFPHTEVEDSTMLERIDRFIESARIKARTNTVLPDARTLLTRVSLLGRELAAAKAEVKRYAALVEALKSRVAALKTDASDNDVQSFKAWFLNALEGRRESIGLNEGLFTEEVFLRIMAAHVLVMPSGNEYFVEGEDNLLESGLSAGLSLDYGCSDGRCGRCKVKLLSGETRQVREPLHEMPEAEQAAGHLLACCHTAVTDIVIEAAEAMSSDDIELQNLTVTVSNVKRFDDAVLVQVRYQGGQRLRFLAGQYARVQLPNGAMAETAIAICPCDERRLEFHFCDQAPKDFYDYAVRKLKDGDELNIRGPMGDFLLNMESGRPLLFIAFDTGFAAIKSLVEHAMALDSTPSIHLYRVSTIAAEPSLDNLCRSWADALDEFSYRLIRATDARAGFARLMDSLDEDCGTLETYDIYLCAESGQVREFGLELEDRLGAVDSRLTIEPIRCN
jgi:CDP-4-dehydro-6-deoxyglucose reductase